MNILSCFDGMSCVQIALNRAGIAYDNYFASEIDRHAITVTQANFPNTTQLGDITKWREWKLPQIDLVIAGSPCQGFSFAGKQLNFDDERSKLFFIFADILDEMKHRNPNLWFLLENVRMQKWCERIITQQVNVDPVFIDSARVSAQTRKRLYWSNIPIVGKPKDKGIYLKDILETEVDEKYYLSQATIKKFNAHAQRNKENGNGFGWNIRTVVEKSSPVLTSGLKSASTFVESRCEKAAAVLTGNVDAMANFDIRHSCAAMRGRGDDNEQTLEIQLSHCSELTTGSVAIAEPFLREPDHVHGELRYYSDKSPTMQSRMGTGGNNVPYVNNIRRLTEIEVERLQTVPDNFTNHVSSTQRYKMLGNGMTVDVIVWILSFMQSNKPRNGVAQESLF